MIALIMELPFLIGDRVPENDEHWLSMIVLLKICKIALAPSCSHDVVSILADLVEEKLTMFKSLYPERNIIPKQHYMVHYPSQILMYGPLVRSWCMGHESKLSFIKQASRRSNFKNVSKTTAHRHQLWLYAQLELDSQQRLLILYRIFSRAQSVQRIGYSKNLSIIIQNELTRLLPQMVPESVVLRPKWVQISSTIYKFGEFVLIKLL